MLFENWSANLHEGMEVKEETLDQKFTTISRKKKIKQQQESLFSLPASKLLDDVTLTARSATLEQICSSYDNATNSELQLLNIKTLSISDKRHCTLCDCDFVHRDQQTEHYQSDWHRFNIKRKLNGFSSLSDIEFIELTNNQSDLSSISGSEDPSSSSSDDETGGNDVKAQLWNKSLQINSSAICKRETNNQEPKERVPLKLFFSNSSGHVFGIHRCLLFNKKNMPESQETILRLVKHIFINVQWAVILVGGGHFAAAIFNRDEIIEHKTFHRYTIRAKQGSSQGSRDGKHGGSHPKSAGAALRRHNESALITDVQKLLASWADQLKQCSLIFYRAPSFNKTVLFSNKNPPFSKNDERLRNIPFATRRATLREVKRVHQCLAQVEIIPDYAKMEFTNIENIASVQPVEEVNLKADEHSAEENTALKVKRKKKKKKTKELENDTMNHQMDLKTYVEITPKSDDEEYEIFNELYTLCKSCDCKRLNEMIASIKNCTADSLIDVGDLLNKQFGSTKLTLLHVSAKGDSPEILKTLLYNGANPVIVNAKGQVPYALHQNEAIRNAFKEFKRDNPDRYDYVTAKIPDFQSAKASKNKKRKPKSKKAAEEVVAVMPDNPCTMCSKDISQLVPFECYNLKFCSTICVRNFRTRQIK